MRGKLKIVPNPTYPKNDFFVAGKEFPCRVRFASVSFEEETGRMLTELIGAEVK